MPEGPYRGCSPCNIRNHGCCAGRTKQGQLTALLRLRIARNDDRPTPNPNWQHQKRYAPRATPACTPQCERRRRLARPTKLCRPCTNPSCAGTCLPNRRPPERWAIDSTADYDPWHTNSPPTRPPRRVLPAPAAALAAAAARCAAPGRGRGAAADQGPDNLPLARLAYRYKQMRPAAARALTPSASLHPAPAPAAAAASQSAGPAQSPPRRASPACTPRTAAPPASP
jgi:hypothetical protein